MLNTLQLQVLTEVAKTGSFTAAAASLGYTQPAVSYQMRRLQDMVGTPVVVRVGRGIELTEMGHALVRHADNVFSVLRAADQEVASLRARGGGLVRIAAFQSGCATLVAALVSRLNRAHPEVRITVVQAEPREARRMVRTGEVDLGLLCNWENEQLPDGENTMLRVALLTDRRHVLMRADDPLAAQESIDLASLASRDWVMESFRDRFTAACTNLGFQPRIAATVDDVGTIQALVASGLGISLISQLALHSQPVPSLVHRALKNWPLRCIYGLLWPDMAHVPAVATVVEEMQRAARDIRPKNP